MNQVKFSEDQLPPSVDYNPFSFVAFLVFVFSLFCIVLAVFNPKLIGLPFLSALAGAFILFRLHKSKISRGRRLAGFALLASLFTLSATISYQSMRYKHLEHAAVEHCESWLNLIKSGNVYAAHEMTIDFEDRHDEGADLSRIYGAVDHPDEDMQIYLELEPEKTIREIGPEAKIRRGKIAYARPLSRYDRFEIHYYVDRTETSENEFHFTIVLKRTRPLTVDVYWEIEGLVNVEPPTPREKRHIGTAGGVSREVLN